VECPSLSLCLLVLVFLSGFSPNYARLIPSDFFNENAICLIPLSAYLLQNWNLFARWPTSVSIATVGDHMQAIILVIGWRVTHQDKLCPELKLFWLALAFTGLSDRPN